MAVKGGVAAMHAATKIHRLPPLPSIRDIIKLYKLRGSKHLSQNFLLDAKLSSKIVSSSGRVRGCHVCEVGPGPGSITRAILGQNAAHVTVIEKDPRFLPTLELLESACTGHLHIELGDVLTYSMENAFPKDLSQPWDKNIPNIRIIGNLPFNISTPLIIRWLRDISYKKNAWVYGRVPMTLTFQYEVAERMVAPPGHHQRCRLSIMCQNWCHVYHKFTIPGRAFIPKPKVDVGVVHLVPRVEPVIPLDFLLVEKVARCTFMFRQKHCKRGLGMLFPEGRRDEFLAKLLAAADVNPTVRAFQLTLSEFNRICHAYEAILEQQPQFAKFNCGDANSYIEGEDYDSDGKTSLEEAVRPYA